MKWDRLKGEGEKGVAKEKDDRKGKQKMVYVQRREEEYRIGGATI